MGKMSVSLVAFMAVLAVFGGAYATGENVVASKAYVDTKQDKIGGGIAGAIITRSGTDGTVGDRGVINNLPAMPGMSVNLETGEMTTTYQMNRVAPVGAKVGLAFVSIGDDNNDQILTLSGESIGGGSGDTNPIVAFDTLRNTINALNIRETATSLSEHGNRWPTVSAVNAGLATKQDAIDAAELEVTKNEDTYNLPAVVAYDTDDGLTGNKYGIVDDSDEMEAAFVSGKESVTLPTVNLLSDFAMYEDIRHLQSEIPASGFGGLDGGVPYDVGSGVQGKESGPRWLTDAVKGTGLVTRTATDGVVGERKIFEQTDVSGYSALTGLNKQIADISIPTVGAMMSAINNVTDKLSWTSTDTTAVNNYSTTFNDATGNWLAADSGKLIDAAALATGLSLKQNKIPGYDASTESQSVITDTTTDGVIGKRTIADAAEYTTSGSGGRGGLTKSGGTQTLSNGSSIATINAVETKQAKIAGYDSATESQSVLVDSTTTGNVEKRGIWESAPISVSRDDANYLVTAGAVASALSEKQNEIDADVLTVQDIEGRSFNLPTVVSYDTTDGLVGTKYGIVDTHAQASAAAPTNSNKESYTVPTLNYMNIKKQDKLDANDSTAFPNGSVVTYGATAGNPGQVAIANAATHNLSTGALTNGGNIATIAAVDAKQDKIPARETKIFQTDATFAPSVVTNGTADGDVGQMAIITADRMNTESLGWDDYVNGDSLIPTLAAVGNEIERVGRDLIAREDDDLIPGQQNVTGMRSVLAPTTAPGVVNQIGLWDADDGDVVSWQELMSNDYGSSATELQLVRQSIPTVGAVEVGLKSLQNQIPDISNLQTKIAASEWEDFRNNTIPGVVISTDENGVVEQRMILDKTSNITNAAIANAVARGYDDGNGYSITEDIHSDSVGVNDVNNAVPTTTMTIAIAKAAADAAANNKQNKISGYDAQNGTQSVLVDSTTDGVVQKRAILDKATFESDLYWDELAGGPHQNMIPDVGTVGSALLQLSDEVQYKIPARATKISASDTTFAPSVVTNGTTDGSVGQMAILTQARKTADGDLVLDDYLNADSLIPTAAAVVEDVNYLGGTKQDKLAANNSTTFPNGSVVTYGATAGNPGQVGIYSGSTPYDATNDSGKIPTMAGVMANVPTDISSNTVNGAPLSNSASYFYGKSTSDATATTKTVSIPSITSLQDGQVIIVTPTVTNTVDSIKLKLNDFPAATIVYAGQAVGYNNSTGQRSIVWSAATPSIFAYEIVSGTGYWRFVGHGKDSNTTYTQMTVATGTAASPSSSGMVVSPATIRGVIQGTKLSDFNSAATATPVTTADTVVGSISKLQAQITGVTADIPTLPTGTSGTVVTYNGVDANNVQQYSENAIASAPVYENGTLTNPNSLATIAAVETKQTKLEANNSTTYPNGSVVTYGATAGNPGQVAIANAPAYNQSTGALTNGTDIASVAAVNTAVNAVKPVCVGWETGHENNDEYCYFWSVPE